METVAIVDKKDRRVGIITAVLSLLLVFLYLLYTTFEIADPPPVEIPMAGEMPPLSSLEFKDLKIETSDAGGAGAPSDEKVDPTPQPTTEKILSTTKEKPTKVTTGNASTTTTEKSNEESTTKVKSNNPFGGGGEDGIDGPGKKGVIGKEDGGGRDDKGKGISGGGGGATRIRLNDPYIDNIESDGHYEIHLKVKIDAKGNVVDASSTAKTTTTDQRLINKVIAATVQQTKYNAKPGADIEIGYITLVLSAK